MVKRKELCLSPSVAHPYLQMRNYERPCFSVYVFLSLALTFLMKPDWMNEVNTYTHTHTFVHTHTLSSYCVCLCLLVVATDFPRWIKFEEKVEAGGERWSKPHVATLSLHSLFELKTCIEKGTIILDMEAGSLQQVVGTLALTTFSTSQPVVKNNKQTIPIRLSFLTH